MEKSFGNYTLDWNFNLGRYTIFFALLSSIIACNGFQIFKDEYDTLESAV